MVILIRIPVGIYIQRPSGLTRNPPRGGEEEEEEEEEEAVLLLRLIFLAFP